MYRVRYRVLAQPIRGYRSYQTPPRITVSISGMPLSLCRLSAQICSVSAQTADCLSTARIQERTLTRRYRHHLAAAGLCRGCRPAQRQGSRRGAGRQGGACSGCAPLSSPSPMSSPCIAFLVPGSPLALASGSLLPRSCFLTPHLLLSLGPCPGLGVV